MVDIPTQRFRNGINFYPDKVKFNRDNRELNHCDCYKDAKEEPSIGITNILFNTATESLFGKVTGSKAKTLERIKDDIMSNEVYGNIEPQKVSWLQTLTKKEIKESKRPIFNGKEINLINKLPNIVKYGFHDSGYSPFDVRNGIQVVLTPASYIDPGPRAKFNPKDPNLIIKGTEYVINEDIFKDIGFENAIKTFRGKDHGNGQMEIQIGMVGDTFTVYRTNEQGYIPPGLDYFGGNTIKNTWFNDPTNAKNSKDAKRFILAKELGDTLQVVFAKIIMGAPNQEYCMFTDDSVVATRSRELQLPFCIKDRSIKEYENLGRCLYYLPTIDKREQTKKLRDMYLDQCIHHNNTILFNIRLLLFSRYIIVSGEEEPVNEAIKAYFREIYAAINIINVSLIAVLRANDNNLPENPKLYTMYLESIKHILASNTVTKILENHKGICKINYYVKSLFPPGVRNEIDPILNKGRSLGEHIVTIRNPRAFKPYYKKAERRIRAEPTQRGGDDEDSMTDIFFNKVKEILYSKLKDGTLYTTNIFWNLSEMKSRYEKLNPHDVYEFDIERAIDDIAFNFLCVIYNYLNYVGESPTDGTILKVLLNIFLDNIFEGYTIDIFYKNYNHIIIEYKRMILQGITDEDIQFLAEKDIITHTKNYNEYLQVLEDIKKDPYFIGLSRRIEESIRSQPHRTVITPPRGKKTRRTNSRYAIPTKVGTRKTHGKTHLMKFLKTIRKNQVKGMTKGQLASISRAIQDIQAIDEIR